MKLYYYSGATLPSEKAQSVHVMKICAAFTLAKHNVVLFGKGDANQDIFAYYGIQERFQLALAPNIPIPVLSGLYRLLSISRFAFKAGKPDFVYGRDLIALFLFTPRKTPFAIEIHQIPKNIIERATLKWLITCKNFKGLVCISDGLKADLLNWLPSLKERVLVAHDGADLPSRKPTYTPKKKTPLCIGYAGSSHQGKGIELITKLAALCPDHEFHIWGASNTALTENLYVHGVIPHSEIPKALQSCDILLAPYQAETTIASGANIARWISPLKLFEYMAASRPILCSDLPVLREILTDQNTALMLPPDNPKAWKNAIDVLQADQTLAKFLAENAYQMLKTKYTWNHRAKTILNFITAKNP